MISAYFLKCVIVTSQNNIHHIKLVELVWDSANHMFSSHIDIFVPHPPKKQDPTMHQIARQYYVDIHSFPAQTADRTQAV